MTAPEIIRSLMDACTTLMDEVMRVKAADWQRVNDAMVAGAKYLARDKGGSDD